MNEVRPGDVLLVTKIEGEPLGELISDLDGSDFAHSGIALGGGRMASAHTSWWYGGRLDLGGIRHDRLEAFWGDGRHYRRSIYRLPVASSYRRDRALKFVRRFPESRDGDFSFVKIFLVAAALDITDPDHLLSDRTRERLLARVRAAGHAWASSEDDPSFYCAEFVASAFDATFPVDTLTPPAGHGTGWRLSDVPRFRGPIEGLLDKAFGDAGTARQRTALGALVSDLFTYDRAFLARAARTLADEVADGARGALARDVPPVTGLTVDPKVPHLGGGERLPHALVTPRMLRDADWTGPPQRVLPPDGLWGATTGDP